MFLLCILLFLPASGERIVEINDSDTPINAQAAQIYINSIGDFSFYAVSGFGNSTHPWIIENKYFNLTDQTKHGIHIEDTTAYFIVQNCIIFGAGGDNYGIFLDNVDNGHLLNNTLNLNRVGIEIRGSSNINLTDNTCNTNRYYGIRIDDYLSGVNQYIRLVNNTCSGQRDYDGIIIDNSHHCTLINNTMNSNAGQGIWLSSSSYNTLIGNEAHGNGNSGILMKPSNYNTLLNNTATGNWYHGIRMENSINNTLYFNIANNNYGNGFHLNNADYCNLTLNTANSNQMYGVELTFSSSQNIITFNTLKSNEIDCLYESDSCSGNIIQNNICVTGGDGVPGFLWIFALLSLILLLFQNQASKRKRF